MDWDKEAQIKFRALIDKIPVFLRAVAEEKVAKRAETLAQKENHKEVTEKDLVDAFFTETPFGFHGPMKSDMKEIGVDYTKYGYEA